MIYQVDSEDANFLFLERTDSPTHISLIALYDQSGLGENGVRFRNVLQLIKNRLSSAPVFQQKIKRVPGDLDYPYWYDDAKFDLDYHVRHLALPKPGDWRQFCIQVSRLHSRPLDSNHPLWELYVIEGLENVDGLPPGSFAVYFKIHHCAMDEFTEVELLESLHETVANPNQHKTPAQVVGHLSARAPGLKQMLAYAGVNNALRSARMLAQSISNYRLVSKLLARGVVRAVRKYISDETFLDVAPTRFGGQLGTARVFGGDFFPRKVFDQLAAMVPSANFTHVLLLVCGEALRLYLDSQGEDDQTPLHALLQINVRNAGAHALVGNRIAIEQADLFTHIPHLIERLHAIVGSFGGVDDIENVEERGLKLRAIYEHVPAPLMALMGRYSNRDGNLSRGLMHAGNCGIAEIDGPKVPLYFLGAKLHGLTSISPLYSGCGLIFASTSYCDKVALTFTSDRDMMPEPMIMQECIASAVAGLEKLLPVGIVKKKVATAAIG
jgi:diacylglycerol O-acyltransferase